MPEDWKPAKTRQKDRDARWSIKYSKAKAREGADPKAAKPVDLAIPMFGYGFGNSIERKGNQLVVNYETVRAIIKLKDVA